MELERPLVATGGAVWRGVVMGCVAFNGRMHDTVSETSFGPECRDDDEAAQLIGHIRRTRGMDPRRIGWVVGYEEIDRALAELRDGSAASMPTHPDILCACGSGKPRNSLCATRGKIYTRCSSCFPPPYEGNGTEVPAERAEAVWRAG